MLAFFDRGAQTYGQYAFKTLPRSRKALGARSHPRLFRVSYHFGNVNQSKLPYKNLAELAITQDMINDSPLDKLLFKSFISHNPVALVMISMEDNKVYVGKVIEMGEPTETEGMDQEILIEPTRSGYRNKDTKIVTFTTYYDKIEGSSAIVLKQDKIISATLFNEQIYRDFQDLHKAKD